MRKRIKPAPINHLEGTLFSIVTNPYVSDSERYDRIIELFSLRNLLRIWVYKIRLWWWRKTQDQVPPNKSKAKKYGYFALVSVDAYGNFVATGFVWDDHTLEPALRGHFYYLQTTKVLIINFLTGKIFVCNRPYHEKYKN